MKNSSKQGDGGEAIQQSIDRLEQWAALNSRKFPWREYTSPFSVLVAEILLRRTTASAVRRVYPGFIRKYSNLSSLTNADPNALEGEMRTLGYNVQRAKILVSVASELKAKYGGIPEDFDELRSIEQVGLYTSAAVMSLGFHRPFPMIDSNVLRIYSRFLGRRLSQKDAFDLLLPHVTEKNHKRVNLGLLDFGAVLCRHRRPLCEECPLNDLCCYAHDNYFKGRIAR